MQLVTVKKKIIYLYKYLESKRCAYMYIYLWSKTCALKTCGMQD